MILKYIVSDGQMELILKRKCTFDVLTILINHFVLFFGILSQKEKFYIKRKNNTQSRYIISFNILCQMDRFFKRFIIYQSGITMNMSNT